MRVVPVTGPISFRVVHIHVPRYVNEIFFRHETRQLLPIRPTKNHRIREIKKNQNSFENSGFYRSNGLRFFK